MSTTEIDRTVTDFADDPTRRAPNIVGDNDYSSVTDKVCQIVEKPDAPLGWKIGFAVSILGVGLLFAMIGYLFMEGLHVWGVNTPVGWGFAIINFVWWIGIGHAGTLISAILFLLRQRWRTAVNRAAEASLAHLQQQRPFAKPIVTGITPASTFYPAEGYHQDYYLKNPLAYRFYRFRCWRDARLRELWGAP